MIGYNMRLDECQAGFLSVKLKYLKEWTRMRQEIAEWYNDALKNIEGLILPVVAENATHVYHIYMIRTKERDALQRWLNTQGIGTLIHYPIPPYLQKSYNHLNYMPGDFPIAEEIASTCLSLPVWPGLKMDQVKLICSLIKKFYQ